MYGTNKASGLSFTVQPDTTLTYLGGTASGTNTGSLTNLVANVSILGLLSLPTVPATFVNNATALDIIFSICTPVANMTYQEFMTIANSGTSGLSGGAWSGGVISGVNAFTAWFTMLE